MSIAISKIFKEARREGMPLSAPGIILYSLETAIPDRKDKTKAHKYKIPYFTDARLLTHDQLERINKIIEEKHELVNTNKPKKEVSVLDMSSLDSVDSPWLKQSQNKQIEEQKINNNEKTKKTSNDEWLNENKWLNENTLEQPKKIVQKTEQKKMTKRDKLNKHKLSH